MLGRRGASLLVYAVIWTIAGLTVFIPHGTQVWHIISLSIWGGLFLAAGLTAAVCSFRRTPAADRFGFMALIGVGLLWVVRSIVTEVLAVTTDIGLDYRQNGLSLLTTTLLMVKVFIDAGWAEHSLPSNVSVLPPLPPKDEPEREHEATDTDATTEEG